MDHHPQGPSSLSGFAKCCGLIKTQKYNEMTEEGSFGHRLWETGERPAGYEELNSLVDKLDASWHSFLSDLGGAGPHVTEFKEVRLEDPSLNFGTCDRLVFNPGRTVAAIGDAKFGNWSVDEASLNLQGINYAVLVCLMYPTVNRIWVWFGNPRREEYTYHCYHRDELMWLWKPRIMSIISMAQNPNPANFKYDPVNCGFCARLDCPVRLSVAESYPTKEPGTMTTEELQKLKTLSNSLKILVDGVDKEAKKRVLDDGEEMEGYEPKERVRRRVIYGTKNIDGALKLASELVGAASINAEEDVELSFSSLESLFVNFFGDKKSARPYLQALQTTLEDKGLLTTETFFYLAAKQN